MKGVIYIWTSWLTSSTWHNDFKVHPRYSIPFYGQIIIFHCMDVVLFFFFTIFYWWTLCCFPLLPIIKKCCYEHSYTSFCVDTCFHFLGYIPRGWIVRSYGNSSLVKELPDCVPKWSYQFIRPLTTYQGSSFSTSWSTVVITIFWFK